MTHAPLVSIGIPTYNRAATYLGQCLKSALGQSYGELEIIVSDNGSTDGTAELVAGFQDPRVRYYRQSSGLSPNENFNFCLSKARGRYFQLLLDDESIDSDFVASCVTAAAGRDDVGLVRTGLRVVNADGAAIEEMPNRTSGPRLSDLALSWFCGGTALYLCNTLFDRGALSSLGGFRSRHNLFQDVVAQFRIAASLARIDIEGIKATTRRHAGQYTYSAKVREWCVDSLDLLELIVLTAGERQDEIRSQGLKFFANICYSRANAVRGVKARFGAYREVYRTFGRQCMPSTRLVVSATSAYRSIRRVKRKMLNRPAWID